MAALAEAAKPPPTPLQRRLGGLTRLMVVLGMLITVALTGIRLASGRPARGGLPARRVGSSRRCARGAGCDGDDRARAGRAAHGRPGRAHARLPAVETLGSTTVVASDKTGTLTENRLRVRAVAPAGGRSEEDVLRAAVLASTADLIEQDGELRVAGDPVEGAFLLAARRARHLAGAVARRS